MDSRGKFLAVAGSAFGQRVNDEARVRRERHEPHVGHGVFMQTEFGRMFDHFRFGGGAVRIHEDGFIGGGSGERSQVSGLQCIEARPFLSDDLLPKRIGGRAGTRSSRRWWLRLRAGKSCHHCQQNAARNSRVSHRILLEAQPARIMLSRSSD